VDLLVLPMRLSAIYPCQMTWCCIQSVGPQQRMFGRVAGAVGLAGQVAHGLGDDAACVYVYMGVSFDDVMSWMMLQPWDGWRG
jgi:hypothetical protein